MALRQLQDEVPGVTNEATTGLEQPLLEPRQRPALDGERQDQPAQEIAEIVGDDPEEQAHFVGPEPMAGEPGPVGGGLALLDPLLCRPALVVEADDGPVRPRQGGDDEAHPRKEFPEMMLDLRDHASRPVPGRRLILEAAVSHQRGMARSAAWPNEQILDAPLQHVVGREADRVSHPLAFQRLVEGGQREGRVRADNDGLPLRAVAVNDGKEHAVPPVRTVHVARPQLGREAVTLWIEDEARVIADGLEVAVVGRLLLRTVDRALRAVDIESHPPVR